MTEAETLLRDVAQIIDPHSFLPIKEDHEWAEDMARQSQELALSKARRIIALLEPDFSKYQQVWVQNLISHIDGSVTFDDEWKAIFIEQLRALAEGRTPSST